MLHPIPETDYVFDSATRRVLHSASQSPALTFTLNGELHARVVSPRGWEYLVNIDKMPFSKPSIEELTDPEGEYRCVPIPEYPDYLVSPKGLVYSTRRRKPLQTHRRNHGPNAGYRDYVWLVEPGTKRQISYSVERLLRELFPVEHPGNPDEPLPPIYSKAPQVQYPQRKKTRQPEDFPGLPAAKDAPARDHGARRDSAPGFPHSPIETDPGAGAPLSEPAPLPLHPMDAMTTDELASHGIHPEPEPVPEAPPEPKPFKPSIW